MSDPTQFSIPNYSLKPPQRTIIIRLIGRTLLTVIILLCLFLIITWALVVPRMPHYSVENGFIRPHNLTDRKLNATFTFVINSYNRNKNAWTYTRFTKTTVKYKDQDKSAAATAIAAPFWLSPANRTVLKVEVEAEFVAPFGEMGKVGEGEAMPVTLQLTAEIRYSVGKWTTKDRVLNVYCAELELQIKSSSPRAFEKKNCRVDV